MIHGGCQPQRDVGAIAVRRGELGVDHQVFKRVAEAFRLNERGVPDPSKGPNDPVAGTDDHLRPGVDRPGPVLQFSNEAIVQASESRFPGFLQVEVPGEQFPCADREVSNDRMLNVTEPAHEPRCQTAGNPVGQEEVDGLLLKDSVNQR